MSQQGPSILSEGEGPVVADVVFVHGLRGNRIATWSHGSVCWPRDLLPKDLKNARIITWGYDSAVAKLSDFSSQASISSHAENLLSDVSRIRRGDRARPLLFVGHSLGGLVIKQALIRSSEYLHNSQDTNLGAVYKNTHGVLFLGTPHRGSDKTNLAHIVAAVATVAFRGPNTKLIRTLEEDSDFLEGQRKSFASVSKNLTLICFCEEVPTKIGLIVPERSACIDGFNVRTGSIPKDHMEMCKFASRDEIGYQRTSGHLIELVDMVEGAMTAHQQAEELAQQRKNKAIEDIILKSLYFQEMNYRHEDINEAHKKTFEWLYTDPRLGFVEWLERENGIFWTSGVAGSGKSTLIKFLLNDPRTREHLEAGDSRGTWTVASFFCHDRGTPLQKSQTGLLRSLLHQVLEKNRWAIPSVCATMWANSLSDQDFNHSTDPSVHWSPSELMKCFRRMVNQISSQGKLFLLIDGLDEYEGDKNDLVELLLQHKAAFADPACQLKLCISSRPWNVFENEFKGCRKLRLQDLTESDIRRYVYDKLKDNKLMQRLQLAEPRPAANLVRTIVDKASGVFLWVRLVVKSLMDGLQSGDRIDELQNRLLELPETLYKLYEHMLGQIAPRYHQEATQIFQIMEVAPYRVYAIGLWSIGDKTDGMSLQNQFKSLQDIISGLETVSARLRSRCAGLLEISWPGGMPPHNRGAIYDELVEIRVNYLHQTVKDHMEQSQVFKRMTKETQDTQFTPLVWKHMQSLALIKMRFSVLKGSSAAYNWTETLYCLSDARDAAEDTGKAQTTLLEDLNRTVQEHISTWEDIIFYVNNRNKDRNVKQWRRLLKCTPPHWSLLFLYQYEEFWIRKDRKPYLWLEERCSREDTFLSLAVRYGLYLYVKETLERQAYPVCKNGSMPLLHHSLACVTSGPDPYHPGRFIKTIAILLEHHADPNAVFPVYDIMALTGYTESLSALQIAMALMLQYGLDTENIYVELFLDVVWLLLKYGGDVNVPINFIFDTTFHEESESDLSVLPGLWLPLDVLTLFRNLETAKELIEMLEAKGARRARPSDMEALDIEPSGDLEWRGDWWGGGPGKWKETEDANATIRRKEG